MTVALGLVLGIVFFTFVFVAKGIRIVRQAESMVIERLGRYHRTLNAGISLILPWLDRPRVVRWQRGSGEDRRYFSTQRIDLREAVQELAGQSVITRDNVVVAIDALIYSQVTDPVRATYEIANLPDAIEKLTQTTLRNVIGGMELDQVLSSRDTINLQLREILDEATHKWGAKVTRVELKDIHPPTDIRSAMEKQMRAERNRRAVILAAEAGKQSSIIRTEGIRQSEITKAEGKKQSQILRAEAKAAAQVLLATAEANAVEQITESVRRAGGDPLQYLIATQYIESLRRAVKTAGDNRVVFIPEEFVGVLSSIGAVKEIFDPMELIPGDVAGNEQTQGQGQSDSVDEQA
jgi:regulator of protease activity HflC (stomatin/prohibitin superfamily)